LLSLTRASSIHPVRLPLLPPLCVKKCYLFFFVTFSPPAPGFAKFVTFAGVRLLFFAHTLDACRRPSTDMHVVPETRSPRIGLLLVRIAHSVGSCFLSPSKQCTFRCRTMESRPLGRCGRATRCVSFSTQTDVGGRGFFGLGAFRAFFYSTQFFSSFLSDCVFLKFYIA